MILTIGRKGTNIYQLYGGSDIDTHNPFGIILLVVLAINVFSELLTKKFIVQFYHHLKSPIQGQKCLRLDHPSNDSCVQ